MKTRKLRTYDVGIVGGGIAGLYCAYKLSATHRVILLDERDYAGGRIQTHREGYEIGAARFNNHHKLLNSLIKTFGLTPMPLPQRMDYRTREVHIPNVHRIFGMMIDKILEKRPTARFKDMTFFELASCVLGKQKAEDMVRVFGYYSEIVEMNAYDAYITFKTDFGNIKYYVLQEGLSELCKRMVAAIRENGGVVRLNHRVKNVRQGFLLDGKYRVKRVIFATKPHQLREFSILSPIHRHIKSVYQAPLIRVYARYPTPAWFEDVHRTTTDGILRQIIPIRKDIGLIMVSYTDGRDTLPFMRNGKIRSDSEIQEIITRELTLLFPDKRIPKPKFMRAYLWTVGCHHWRPGYDSDIISQKVLNPIEGVYICGEGFSRRQAWIEGALETASEVVASI